MAITATTTLTGLTDTSPSGSPVYTVTKRCVSSKALDLLNTADMLELKTAAFGEPLAPLVTPMVDTFEHGRSRLRSTTVTPVPGTSNKIFDVIGRYDSMYTMCVVPGYQPAGTPPPEPILADRKLMLPVLVDIDATPRPVIMHRSAAISSWQVEPEAELNSGNDIGGSKVDYGSKPLPGLVPQMTIRVSLIIDATRWTMNVLYDNVSLLSGKWNSGAFLHWSGQKQVYCESANVSHVRDEYYRVTYLLKWDQWYGCEQIPKTDVNGRAAIDDQGQAQVVTWKSMVRGTANFSLMFNHQPYPTYATMIAKDGTFLTPP